jgi:hypothetical protein
MTTKVAPAQQAAAWETLWGRSDYTLPIQYGLETSCDDSGRKLYRAWCSTTLGDEQKRTQSDVFIANDQADPDFSIGEMRFQGPAGREALIHNAALVRGAMSAQEKSPADMEALAMDLHTQAQQVYHAWQRAEEEAAARRIDDEQALQRARELVRGISLLPDKERAALRKLLQV